MHLAILCCLDKEVKKFELRGSWDGWANAIPMVKRYIETQSFSCLKKNIKISSGEKSTLYKAWIEVPPGKHEYKYQIDGEWYVDPLKDLNENHNHYFETAGHYKVYQNTTHARRAFNLLHQKVCEEYPEFYIYQPVK